MKSRLAATALVTISASALALGACTTDGCTTTPGGKAAGDGNYTIAVVPKDATNPWFVRMETGVNKYASDTGMNVFQKGPAETDATMQAQVIQDLIAQGVDAICVVPVDPGAIEPVLKQAMDAGIVVVTHEGASQENTMYDIEAFNNTEYGASLWTTSPRPWVRKASTRRWSVTSRTLPTMSGRTVLWPTRRRSTRR